jgi:hypothetical protein
LSAHVATGLLVGTRLRRHDRGHYVPYVSRTPGHRNPRLSGRERDPLPGGLLAGSLRRDGYGGASRATRTKQLSERDKDVMPGLLLCLPSLWVSEKSSLLGSL